MNSHHRISVYQAQKTCLMTYFGLDQFEGVRVMRSETDQNAF